MSSVLVTGCLLLLVSSQLVESDVIHSFYQASTVADRRDYFISGHPSCDYLRIALTDISDPPPGKLQHATFCSTYTSCDHFLTEHDSLILCTFRAVEFAGYDAVNVAMVSDDTMVWVKQDETQYIYHNSDCDVWPFEVHGGHYFNDSDVAEGRAIVSITFYECSTGNDGTLM